MQQTRAALLDDASRSFSVGHPHGESRLSRIPHCQAELKVRNIRDRLRRIHPQIKMLGAKSVTEMSQNVAPAVHAALAPVCRVQSRSQPLKVTAFATVNFYVQICFRCFASRAFGRAL